jgi:hypothetical protein
MPAPVTIVRPTHGPTATISAPEFNAETVVSANVRDATTIVEGVVRLAGPGVSAPLIVPQANDPRLSDSRPPTLHTHVPGDITGLAPLILAALDSRTAVGSTTVAAPGVLAITVPAGLRAGLFIFNASNEPTGSITQAYAFTFDFLDSDLVHLTAPLSITARISPVDIPAVGAAASRINITVNFPNTFVTWAFLKLP